MQYHDKERSSKSSTEEKLDDQLIQYSFNKNEYDNCRSRCEKNWHGNPKNEAMCKVYCHRSIYEAPEHPSQESALIDVSNTLRDIGDSFYSLANSVPDLI